MSGVSKKLYFQITFVVFSIVGVVHLIRAVSDWPFIVGDYILPVWFSYLAGILLLYLATHAYRYFRKGK